MTYITKPSIWFIILVIAFPQLSETIFAPLLPFIVDKFETTQTLSQMSLSLYFLGFAFGVLFWGSLSDYIGRKRALLLGLFCYSLGSFLLYTSTSIYILLFYRIIQAFGAASGSAISQTLLRECFTEEKERVVAFSTISAALAWTPALGPFFGGQLLSFFGMESVFLFLAFLGVGIFFCTSRVLKETHQRTEASLSIWSVFKKMSLDRRIYLYAILVAGFNCVIFSIYSESPFVFMKTFGWSAREYSFIGVGMAIFSVIGAYFNKRLSQKGWEANKRIKVGLLWMIFSSSLYLLPSLFSFDKSSAFTMAWVLFSLCLVFVGVVIALPSVLSESLLAYKDCLGTAGALFGLGYYLFLSLLLSLVSFFPSESLGFLGLLVIFLSSFMFFITKKIT